jgi:hypothetical protein
MHQDLVITLIVTLLLIAGGVCFLLWIEKTFF